LAARSLDGDFIAHYIRNCASKQTGWSKKFPTGHLFLEGGYFGGDLVVGRGHTGTLYDNIARAVVMWAMSIGKPKWAQCTFLIGYPDGVYRRLTKVEKVKVRDKGVPIHTP
jgi:hypothetical protein